MIRATAFRTLGGALLALLASGLAGMASAQVYPTHLDRSKLPLGCLSCHAGGHGAKKSALLKAGNAEVCLRCHDLRSRDRNINITRRTDLKIVFDKGSRHPIEEKASLHRTGENLSGSFAAVRRHVACDDCHDVHWSTPRKTLERVEGIDSFGVRVFQARAEYEICYRCHADSTNLPQKAKNKRLEFNRNNPSFHPIEAGGKGLSAPSLMPPMNARSTITCSDCHGNDDSQGAKGPHGSIYAPILALHYETKDGLQESPYQYALCYKCHDRNSLLRNQSFPLHNLHLVKVRASCYACHTSHGSQTNTHLIHFSPDVGGVQPRQAAPVPFPQPGGIRPGLPPRQQLPGFPGFPPSPFPQTQIGQTPLVGTIETGRYVDLGNGRGQCFVNCHGKEHNPLSY